MHLIHRAGLALLTATLAATAACSENVAPPPPPPPAVFDGPQARAQVEPLAAVLDQPIVRSFVGALSYYGAILSASSAAGVTSTAQRAPAPLRFSRSLAPLEPLASLGTISIPTLYAGKTFTFDPVANYYAVDPTVTGAPANGVRFVLYVFDETGYPDEPLTRLGFLDITPAADGQDGVHLVVVRDAPQLTIADFERTRTAITGGDSFRLDGWATDGTTKMDVALDGSETGPVGAKLLLHHSVLSASSLGVGVDLQTRFDQAAQSSSGKYAVSYLGHTFTDETTPPAGAELRFDGRLYANVVQATGGSVSYVKADGTPLSDAEIADVQGLISRVGAASFFWIGLAAP